MVLGDSWFLPTLLPSCPCLLTHPWAPLSYLFLQADLSRANPEPWASSGRGNRVSPAFPAAVLECGASAQPCFCKVLRFTLPSASLPLPLSSPLSSSVRCFKEKKIYGSGSKSCFPCPGASRCMLLAGSALPCRALPGSTAPSPLTKDGSCYPALAASRAPAPGAAESILGRARYMQLPAPPLKDKIPFPHSHPGKNVNFKIFLRRKSK